MGGGYLMNAKEKVLSLSDSGESICDCALIGGGISGISSAGVF